MGIIIGSLGILLGMVVILSLIVYISRTIRSASDPEWAQAEAYRHILWKELRLMAYAEVKHGNAILLYCRKPVEIVEPLLPLIRLKFDRTDTMLWHSFNRKGNSRAILEIPIKRGTPMREKEELTQTCPWIPVNT